MDNVTHSLTGLALARAGLDRFSPHAAALLILSSNAPDVDIVALAKGSFAYFEAHRGYSHSLVLLPVMAALSMAVVAAIFRCRLPWRNAFLLCCIGVAGHLLLDWTNSYGTRLFLPLSSRWFYADINPLYDVYILLALILAALWPLFARLVSSEIGDRPSAGRAIAISALVFFLLFDVARTTLHARAIGQLNSRIYGGEAPLEAAALPQPFSPLRWTGIVETSPAFRVFRLNPVAQFDPSDHQTFYRLPSTPALQSAKQINPFRYFVYFARFPVWSDSPIEIGNEAGQRIALTDLRFGVPDAGSFHCVAVENDRQQILQTWFTFGSGADFGWGGAQER